MADHQMKEPLPKSSRKPQPSTQTAPTTAEGAHDDLIRLQRLIGNHAVQRMLADQAVAIQQRTAPTVQAKMTVGAADDAYEQEADAVADQVMAKRDVVQRAGEEDELQMKRMDVVQRAGPEEEELQAKRVDIVQRAGPEEEELQAKRIQRKDDEQPVDMSGSFDVGADVESQISAKSGSGQRIPDVNRELFESTMGHDFSGVNVHADAESDSLNKQLGARAFTTGSDIFFRQGEYNPASSGGQELLAHELTHVVQQGGAAVQKKAEED